jgi:hypothetical protein
MLVTSKGFVSPNKTLDLISKSLSPLFDCTPLRVIGSVPGDLESSPLELAGRRWTKKGVGSRAVDSS